MDTIALLLLLLLVGTFVGYPVLVIAAAPARPRRPDPHARALPRCSILICAHNEAARIGDKLASVRTALERAGMPCEILVGDDGSTDETAAIAEAAGVKVVRCPRGGKAAALNRLVPMLSGEVVVMTDADPLFDERTLPALLAPFADPAVGAVAGRVETIRSRGSRFAAGDALFRMYESRLRAAEDRLFGCISADGGLYAIRTELIPPVPADVTDDFWISTAAVAAGRRIAFADDARVWEHSIAVGRQQFRRRLRITVRGLTALWKRRALMNPARTGWYAVGLVLHKVARRLAPLTLLPLWLVAALLAGRGEIAWLLVFLGMTGAGLLAGLTAATGVRLPAPLRPVHGVMLHLAGLALGAVLFACGRRYSQWTPKKDAEIAS